MPPRPAPAASEQPRVRASSVSCSLFFEALSQLTSYPLHKSGGPQPQNRNYFKTNHLVKRLTQGGAQPLKLPVRGPQERRSGSPSNINSITPRRVPASPPINLIRRRHLAHQPV